MRVQLIAYGVRHGIQHGLDLRYDVRYKLRNPYRNPDLRFMSGLDSPVQDDVRGSVGYDHLLDSMVSDIRNRKCNGKAIQVGISCTGGRHRSVVLALDLGARLISLGYEVDTNLRDRDRWDEGE